MKLKALVVLGSFLMLTALIVCVSVYAYNAYGSKSIDNANQEVTMYASVNGWGLLGLDDGVYSMSAKVGSSENRVDDVRYANGNLVSTTISETGPIEKKGESHAYINGWDPTYTPIKKVSAKGSATHHPE